MGFESKSQSYFWLDNSSVDSFHGFAWPTYKRPFTKECGVAVHTLAGDEFYNGADQLDFEVGRTGQGDHSVTMKAIDCRDRLERLICEFEGEHYVLRV